jgi:hypothetical protein
MEPDKCSDLDWFPLDNLPDNTSDFVRQAIKKILNGVNYSVYTFS